MVDFWNLVDLADAGKLVGEDVGEIPGAVDGAMPTGEGDTGEAEVGGLELTGDDVVRSFVGSELGLLGSFEVGEVLGEFDGIAEGFLLDCG